ncbi:glutamyl-tRNA synthetase 2, mitochondrial [Homo sapiens]|uniref:Glutamyl-tRNA synthetase 2, mitochondrial n=1 Tax=Homo sapiens TaxID=9606 RepID=I3L166_HUMAN|nr:glutamyl-tRNA synthetase 2, mitochondrial [Homo sapiens]KAI4054084.1 glutamyl-tRNA synthetase 2, mitochondrial [Homo sapiens]
MAALLRRLLQRERPSAASGRPAEAPCPVSAPRMFPNESFPVVSEWAGGGGLRQREPILQRRKLRCRSGNNSNCQEFLVFFVPSHLFRSFFHAFHTCALMTTCVTGVVDAGIQ